MFFYGYKNGRKPSITCAVLGYHEIKIEKSYLLVIDFLKTKLMEIIRLKIELIPLLSAAPEYTLFQNLKKRNVISSITLLHHEY